MLALCSGKYEDIPKNVGPDESYLVDPKCSGAVTGCKFEQEHWETSCNESHTQEQKPDVNWTNSELSFRLLYKQDRVQVGVIFCSWSLSAFDSARTVQHNKSKY